MKETEYKLYLSESWNDCPPVWQNFINDLRLKQHVSDCGYLSSEDVNNALEPYHAHRNQIVYAIYFAEEKYKNWFFLQWG